MKKNNTAGVEASADTALKMRGKKHNIGELLKKSAYENRFVLLAALCTALIMTVVYYCYNLFPFGEVTILRMDLYHQYGPLYSEFYDRITSGGSLLYSWNTGGGSSFLGNFLNYVSSPFTALMLVFGHKNMPEAIAAIILLKAATASFTCSLYFKKSQKVNNPSISAFGVLYACSGFFIAYYWNVMWLDAFYLLPLIALGIEQIINERKMKLYFFSLILAALTNYYMAYMICLFSVLYFLSYYFGHYTVSETYFGKLAARTDKQPVKRVFKSVVSALRNSRFIDSGVRFAFTSIGAVLSCAFILVPLYYILNACSATSGTWPKDWKTYFTVFDFLANQLAYLDPTIRSSGTDVLPNVYCGVLPLMLVPLYLFSKKTPAREKAADVILLGVFFASFYVNKLNYIWHGFHFPNDLPYRFSFMYSFLLLIMAYKALRYIKQYSTRQILGAGVGIVLFAILVQEIGSKNFTELSLWITVAFVGVYVFTLSLLKDKRYPKYAVAALLLCAVCAEYTVANTNHYSMDQTKSSYAGDYSDFVSLKKQLDEFEGEDHYRMELTGLRARMDPSWYNYNGVSIFSSMAYEKVSNLQYQLGLFGNYINSHTYNPQTPVYNAMFALDYVVDNGQKISNTDLYTQVATCGNFKAYRNNYTLPISYRVNNNVLGWSHDDTDPFAVQNSYIETATGVTGVLENIIPYNAEYSNIDNFTDEEFALGSYYFNKPDTASDGKVTMHFTVPKTQNVYIYLKSSTSCVKSINISSDFGYYATQSVDSKPYVYDMGIRQAGETVTVEMPIADSNTGVLYFHVAGLNMQAFLNAYNTLSADSLNVTSFKDTKITGDINVSEDGLLYSSINYDEGWSVYIDGNKVSKSQYCKIGDALLGVPITAGHHTVTYKYTPQGMLIGLGISVLTICIAIVLLLLIKLRAFDFKPKTLAQELAEKEELDSNNAPTVIHSGDVNIQDTVIYFNNTAKPEITHNTDDKPESESPET